MTFGIDTYTLRARLQPALLVVLPLGLAMLAWSPQGVLPWGALWSLIVWGGGTALLSQIGRDMGKKKEAVLFKAWGGKPTTRLLRHRDAPNKVTLTHRHQTLQKLQPELRIPSADEEYLDPVTADEIYDALTTLLREKTRDHRQYLLVFEENCNYGFRRNLWGMKPLGITTAVFGTGASAILAIASLMNTATVPLLAIACTLISFFLLLGWLVWFTPEWVRTPAEAYAERLLETCDNL